jgi:FtsP/CotA-like multicopper oxidase with cupredoxin domain
MAQRKTRTAGSGTPVAGKHEKMAWMRLSRLMPPRRVPFMLLALLPLLAGPGLRAGADAGSNTRHYYVAAEEVQWDYAPALKKVPGPWTGNTRQKKIRYIEYTDETFKTRKPQPEWLGILGPIIRAEVGDTVLVHFLNRTRGHYGIHPHGVRYTKDHEGAFYPPAGAGAGAKIPPGGRFTYTWTADEGSGPGPADPSSIVWWYHSHVDEPVETNLGLLGPIIVTGRGQARSDAAPADVDREFVVLFMIFNENRDKDDKAERGLMHSAGTSSAWGASRTSTPLTGTARAYASGDATRT